MQLHLSLVAILAAFSSPILADTILHAGRLIDSISAIAREEVSLVVADSKIVRIEEGYAHGKEGDQIIDLRNSTVLPGLMDMHTHLTSESHRGSYAEGPRLDPGTYAIRGVVYAERTLLAGFTTVRDVGDRFKQSIPLRAAIRDGFIPGPRIFTAITSLASTGGHGDRSNGLRSDLAGDPGAREGIVNGVESARQAVRQRYKDGADLIKITATGGVLSLAKNSQNPQFSEEELRAIVDTANDYGFHVAAHAHGAEGMKRAIRAGVRSIEHGTYMDDEVITLMKEHGTYLVPTLLAGEFVAEKSQIDGYYPDIVRPKAAAVGPQMKAMFSKAYAAGVRIAFGTDCGVSPHGGNARELVLMVEAGMPAMEAILAATIRAAELLEIEDRLGSLEVGKTADVIAVLGSPDKDITRLENVEFVMKDGTIYVQK